MEIKKILFFKPGAIGDFLHTLPALKSLKKKYPAAHITVMVSPGLEQLIQGTPLADDVQLFDKAKIKKDFRSFLAMMTGIRIEHYDLFLDMQSSLRSFFLRHFSNAKMVLAYKKQKKFSSRNERLHAAENFMQMLSPLGIHEPVERIELPIQAGAAALMEQFLHERGIDASKPLIALNCSVGAARPARNWFPDRFAALADRLIGQLNANVVYIGGAEDRDLVRSVMSLMQEKALSAAGELQLSHSAALLARCDCLVSSDTGPLHLATAVGTPVVGLYGSTDPRRTGPIGRKNQVLIKDLPCIPCEEKECPLGTRACMVEISVNEVYQSVQKAISCG